MKLRKFFFGIIVATITVGCGVSQSDYDKVKVENEILKAELDDCKFGAERLAARIEKAYTAEDFVLARKLIENLYEKHPESQRNVEFKKLLRTIKKEELKQQRIVEAREKERKRKRDAEKLKSAKSQKLWSYLQKRWNYYEKRDGNYLPVHDKIVIGEAAKKFDISTDEVFQIFTEVEYKRLGIKRKKSLPLRDQNIPVSISILDVFKNSNGRLCITVKNNTNWRQTLPTINLTCDGNSVIWAEDLGYGQTKTFCSLWSTYQDYIKIIAYINIDEMRSKQLRSSVQKANDPGETVIPVLKEKKYKIRK